MRRIIPLWQKQFGGDSTKATFSHDDLPYLKDSIINLWNMGIKCVSANVVFEDAWQEGDPEIYKQQLYELADYIIKNDLWDKYSVRFFDPNVGTPNTDAAMRRNFCGTGTMMAINTNGDYYPCIRFMPSATNNHLYDKLGSVRQKINSDKLRAFSVLSAKNQSPEKCLKCDIAGGCSWCSGVNFDCSSIGTIFERQTYICEMHKANVDVNKYLWRQYELIKHEISPYRYKKITSISQYNKFLYVICSSRFPSWCEYSDQIYDGSEEAYMSEDVLAKVVEFCDANNYVPVFCGCRKLPEDYYAHQIITYDDLINKTCHLNDNYLTQLLIKATQIDECTNLYGINNIIITAKASQLDCVYKGIELLSSTNRHLNVNLSINNIDLDAKEYIKVYKQLLDKLLILVEKCWNTGNYISMNMITNEIFANSPRPCGAGNNNYTVSPDGRFYICAGFYKQNPNDYIGTIDSGIRNIYSKYCETETAPLCFDCNVRHCKRCVFKNKFGTGEYHIPTELQCVISQMEYAYSKKLSEKLNAGIIKCPVEYNQKLSDIDYFDPMKKIRDDYPNCGLDSFVKSLGI